MARCTILTVSVQENSAKALATSNLSELINLHTAHVVGMLTSVQQ